MTPGVALGAAPGPDAWPRRIVCVSVNASIDKIAAVDGLVPGDVHRPDLLSVVPGGKALNVARAAAGLGMPVRAIAVLGGHAGDWMDAALHERGIATSVVRVTGETRTCLSVLDRATGTLTEFYEPGLTLDPAGWAAVETALRSELADDPSGSLVVLAGSLPPGAPERGYARLATIASDAGGRAVVDADGTPLIEALDAGPWLVKVNAREAAAASDMAPTAASGAAGAGRARRGRRSGPQDPGTNGRIGPCHPRCERRGAPRRRRFGLADRSPPGTWPVPGRQWRFASRRAGRRLRRGILARRGGAARRRGRSGERPGCRSGRAATRSMPTGCCRRSPSTGSRDGAVACEPPRSGGRKAHSCRSRPPAVERRDAGNSDARVVHVSRGTARRSVGT